MDLLQHVITWYKTKEYNRLQDKGQLTKKRGFSLYYISQWSLSHMPSRIALFVPCDHLLQKAYWRKH